MEQEAAMGMLEKLGKLRKLLADYDREMQRLKTENEWLKMVLSDCEKKRVDAKGGRIIDMTRPQPCVKYMQQHFNNDKSLYLVGRCLAQRHQKSLTGLSRARVSLPAKGRFAATRCGALHAD